MPANWLQSSLQRTPGSRQHWVGPGRSARDVSTASRAVPELAPAHSAPRGCSRVSLLPAARHFRSRGASALRHFLPLPVWTVGGGRPGPRSPPLFPPSLSLPGPPHVAGTPEPASA